MSVNYPKEIEVKTGIESCGGSAELYQNVVDVFVQEGRKKLPLIKQNYKAENWTDYIIAVHGLKSSAASIGAIDLSAHAKEMEFAGKDNNIQLIHEKTDALLQEYVQLLQKLTIFMRETPKEVQIAFFEEYCD